jgi:hypothetical protein
MIISGRIPYSLVSPITAQVTGAGINLLAAIQPSNNGYHDGYDSRVSLLSPATAAQNPPLPSDERFNSRRFSRVSPNKGLCEGFTYCIGVVDLHAEETW